MIKCPSCNGDKFEHHTISGLLMAGDQITPSLLEAGSKYYTCVECGYVVAQPSDLNLLTVTVYVLGNSLSKQRQGLHQVSDKEIIDKGLMAWDTDDFAANEQALKLFGYFDLPGAWVFTKTAWEKHQANPDFPLADGQHSVDVKELC